MTRENCWKHKSFVSGSKYKIGFVLQVPWGIYMNKYAAINLDGLYIFKALFGLL